MPGPFRVFVSSTMEDLANERAAVVERLREFNFEPVNAEAVPPDGRDSWTVLEAEIAGADAVVLLLGDRYGWIPDSGPHAGSELSVTELEYRYARDLGLPVFPFFKELPYGSHTAPDATARDRFRDEVAAWDGGHFRGSFKLARDLAPQVTRALVEYLVARARAQRDVSGPEKAPVGSLQHSDGTEVQLTADLVSAVADRSAVLFVGAGMSLQAGLPSAAAFTDALVAHIQTADPDYRRGAHGGDLNNVAEDLVKLLGPGALTVAIQDLMVLQDRTAPTAAHLDAVRRFDFILTTNYDDLLERATDVKQSASADSPGDSIDGDHAPLIVKLHGSLDSPESLVVTSTQLNDLPVARSELLDQLRSELRARPVIIVGSSLRDPSVVALLDSCRPELHGWVVNPNFSLVEFVRVREWNLHPIQATAENFFAALSAALDDGD